MECCKFIFITLSKWEHGRPAQRGVRSSFDSSPSPFHNEYLPIQNLTFLLLFTVVLTKQLEIIGGATKLGTFHFLIQILEVLAQSH